MFRNYVYCTVILTITSRVLEFNKFDLYTKDQKGISADELETMWEYYTPLLEKYGLSGELMW